VPKFLSPPLRSLHQFLRDELPNGVITSAVRKVPANVVQNDVHIGSRSLVEFLHGIRPRCKFFGNERGGRCPVADN
jgi:hypothetical protein